MAKAHWTVTHPQLLKEWHPLKNIGIDPMSSKLKDHAWWYLPYDDPETGKHFDFEWKATIGSRVQGNGCPYLSGHTILTGFNDLATKRPDLAAQWHPTKNGELTPEMRTCYSNKKVWWYLPFDDPVTGKHFDFEWQAVIASRMRGSGCPFLVGQSAWPGYNDLASKHPDLVAQWHPTKNGELTPEKVTCNSDKRIWWYLPFDDLETGKHFDFVWQAPIGDRILGYGCPFLSGKAVWAGYNDLATKCPDIAAQWHPTKNGGLTPEMITCYSNKKVWWYLPYDDPETGKHFDFAWQASANDRVQGSGCPFLVSRAVWPGYNDLATKRPDLVEQWHPTKNGGLTPELKSCGSTQKVWWYLPFVNPDTGKHFDFEWQASISERVKGCGCPFLSGQAVWTGFNDLETCSNAIAAEWHHKKNRKVGPNKVYTYEKSAKRWWVCLKCGYEWRATVRARVVDGAICPNCRRNKFHCE